MLPDKNPKSIARKDPSLFFPAEEVKLSFVGGRTLEELRSREAEGAPCRVNAPPQPDKSFPSTLYEA